MLRRLFGSRPFLLRFEARCLGSLFLCRCFLLFGDSCFHYFGRSLFGDIVSRIHPGSRLCNRRDFCRERLFLDSSIAPGIGNGIIHFLHGLQFGRFLGGNGLGLLRFDFANDGAFLLCFLTVCGVALIFSMGDFRRVCDNQREIRLVALFSPCTVSRFGKCTGIAGMILSTYPRFCLLNNGGKKPTLLILRQVGILCRVRREGLPRTVQ